MNKTFKVIFNRFRGALMVANEITRSVQKKGKRCAVATAAMALLSGSALADVTGNLVKRDSDIGSSGTLQSVTISGNVRELLDSELAAFGALEITDGASGTVTNNYSVSMTAENMEDVSTNGIFLYYFASPSRTT